MIELSTKKSILFLSPGFPSTENETDCIPAMQLFLKELSKRELFDIQIITFHYPYQAGVYQWNGIRVYALGGSNKQGIQRILRQRKIFKLIKKFHQIKPIDFIHSFWLGECAWVANRISKKFKIQHICTLMGQDALASNKYPKLIQPLPKMVALSKFHALTVFEKLKISVDIIIPWGIENKSFIESQDRSIDVIGVGNFIPIKNYVSFVKIISKLKEKKPHLKAVLIGRGDEKQKIIELIKKYQLEENIEIIPQIPRDEVLKKMRQSRCFLHCSNFESFGMVIIEALAQGAIVVSKKVGIAAELANIKNYTNVNEAVVLLNECLEKKEALQKNSLNLSIENTVNLYLKKVYLNNE